MFRPLISSPKIEVQPICTCYFSGRRCQVKVSALRLFFVLFFVSFVFVSVALNYASLIHMCFGPGHVSRPYALMAEWLARRTLNQLAWVRFPVNTYQTFFLFFSS